MTAPARARTPGDLEPFAGRWLPPEWPLVFMLAGYPVWWFLGAGAVVTADVPASAIVVGVPAKVVGSRVQQAQA